MVPKNTSNSLFIYELHCHAVLLTCNEYRTSRRWYCALTAHRSKQRHRDDDLMHQANVYHAADLGSCQMRHYETINMRSGRLNVPNGYSVGQIWCTCRAPFEWSIMRLNLITLIAENVFYHTKFIVTSTSYAQIPFRWLHFVGLGLA